MNETVQDSSAKFSWSRVPWQIYLVSVVLALEGLGNLVMIPKHPIAAFWLLGKCFFITGLILGWRPVFVLYAIIGTIHVFSFASVAPFTASLNLALVIMVFSSFRYFFRVDSRTRTETSTAPGV